MIHEYGEASQFATRARKTFTAGPRLSQLRVRQLRRVPQADPSQPPGGVKQPPRRTTQAVEPRHLRLAEEERSGVDALSGGSRAMALVLEAFQFCFEAQQGCSPDDEIELHFTSPVWGFVPASRRRESNLRSSGVRRCGRRPMAINAPRQGGSGSRIETKHVPARKSSASRRSNSASESAWSATARVAGGSGLQADSPAA